MNTPARVQIAIHEHSRGILFSLSLGAAIFALIWVGNCYWKIRNFKKYDEKCQDRKNLLGNIKTKFW